VYALDEGRVLRRFRSGRSAEHEARVMRWLAAQGYPVPVVHEATGPDLVMERLHGPTMSEALRRRRGESRHTARCSAGCTASCTN